MISRNPTVSPVPITPATQVDRLRPPHTYSAPLRFLFGLTTFTGWLGWIAVLVDIWWRH